MTRSDSKRPRGVFAAALTPMMGDLTPDLEGTLAHYRWLLAEGCDGIVSLGTTGEANSFSLIERLAMIEALGISGLAEKCIVGTGCCAVPDTVELTKAAIDAGAAGVLALPPFYYKGIGEEGLYAAYARTIEEIGDARLKLYLYHFPRMTTLEIGHGLIRRLLNSFPGVVVGLKDSSGRGPEMESMIRNFPGFDVFAGTEELLLANLRAGGAGTMTATANLLAREAAELAAKWQTPGADALQQRVATLRQTITAYPGIPALKALTARRTGKEAWRNIRPPLLPLAAEELEVLSGALDTLGFPRAIAAE